MRVRQSSCVWRQTRCKKDTTQQLMGLGLLCSSSNALRTLSGSSLGLHSTSVAGPFSEYTSPDAGRIGAMYTGLRSPLVAVVAVVSTLGAATGAGADASLCIRAFAFARLPVLPIRSRCRSFPRIDLLHA